MGLLQVKEFLPQLKSANVKIQEELTSDPSKQTKYDIENVEGENGGIIEMVCVGAILENFPTLFFFFFTCRIWLFMKTQIQTVQFHL